MIDSIIDKKSIRPVFTLKVMLNLRNFDVTIREIKIKPWAHRVDSELVSYESFNRTQNKLLNVHLYKGEFESSLIHFEIRHKI